MDVFKQFFLFGKEGLNQIHQEREFMFLPHMFWVNKYCMYVDRKCFDNNIHIYKRIPMYEEDIIIERVREAVRNQQVDASSQESYDSSDERYGIGFRAQITNTSNETSVPMKDKMKKMIDLLFDIKEKIPDGHFLQMNTLMKEIFDEL
tara:strand:- start:412 stop:855 length:444 start_codon:yes stop_codon:yes gene_type:complete